VGEDGMDAGGLAKDWFRELARKASDGNCGLLKTTPTGVIIDPRASTVHG